MIPYTRPTTFSNNTACTVVYVIVPTATQQRWIDYIPVKALANDIGVGLLNSNNNDSAAALDVLDDTTVVGKTAWVDYIPVAVVDDPDTEKFTFSNTGFVPVQRVSGDLSSILAPSIDATALQIRAAIRDISKYGETLGAELVTNGGFDSDTWWGKESGWSIAGGVAVRAAGPAGALLRADLFTVGKTYRVTLDTLAMTSTIGIYVGGASATLSATVATGRSVTLTCNTHGTLQIYGGGEYTIDNISVKEVTVGFRLPGSAGLRINASARASVAMERQSDGSYSYAPHNLLTYSEAFDNAAWTKDTSTVVANQAASPNGSVTADLWYPTSNGVTGSRRLLGTVTVPLGAVCTASIYVKVAGRRWVYLTAPDASAASYNCWFDLQTGTVGTKGAGAISSSITDAGGGWYRISATSLSTSSINYLFISSSDADNSTTVTANGTDGLYLWGAQLNLGSTATAYIPTTTAAVYAPAVSYDSAISNWRTQSEAGATNLLLQSANKASASWTKTAGIASITAGTFACPISGALEQLTVTDTGGFYQIASGANSTQYTAWMVARIPPSGNTIRFGLTNQVESTVYYVRFDSTGALTVDGANSWSNGSQSATQIGSTGWYLLVVTATSPASGTTGVGHFCRLLMPGSVAIGHSQLETGPRATSPILTYGATATRAAEQPAVPITGVTEGVLVADGVFVSAAGSGPAATLWGASGAFVTVGRNTGGAGATLLDGYVANAGDQAFMTLAANVQAGEQRRVAVGFKPNDFIVASGALSATDTAGTVPTTTELRLGWFDTSTYMQGGLTRIRLFTKKPANAAIQGLAA